MNNNANDEQFRPGFEAAYTASQKGNGLPDEYIFLTLQRQANGDYSTTFVDGRWHGWVAAKREQILENATKDEALQLARQALENSKSEDVARDVERRGAPQSYQGNCSHPRPVQQLNMAYEGFC
jgi:hypothetical protein